jgi:hypothetical protein
MLAVVVSAVNTQNVVEKYTPTLMVKYGQKHMNTLIVARFKNKF